MSAKIPWINATNAYIFRMVHRDNIDFILRHGLYSRNSSNPDPNYVNIGSAEIVAKRAPKMVPISPGGTMHDYIPFYFTPFSPMQNSLWRGIDTQQRTRDEIVFFVTSLPLLAQHDISFVYSDRHALIQTAKFYSNLSLLGSTVDFFILQNRDFKRDENDPGKLERYQAEALVFRHVPLPSLIQIVCYTEAVRQRVEAKATAAGSNLPVKCIPDWYFR